MLDIDISAAWRLAAEKLGIVVVAPHLFQIEGGGTIEVEAFLPDFGGPSGTIVVALSDEKRCRLAAATKYFVSHLADAYRAFDAKLFQETLDDWGWHAAKERRPAWYTGRSSS